MRYWFAIIFILVFYSKSYSQKQQSEKNSCGADYNSLLSQKTKEIENQTKEFMKRGGAKSLNYSSIGALYAIPVVVHVLYHYSYENITDSQVQSQIDVLNEDYEKLNADVVKVPEVWSNLVADCQIKFCLATIDPNGNATTGIIHKWTDSTFFIDSKGKGYKQHDVMNSKTGGDDPWPATDYLNIWVCQLNGTGINGYATYPGQDLVKDGAVIYYGNFGRDDLNDGRVTTHEIGHWLNLHHLWGDLNNSGCVLGDDIDDTPLQAKSNENKCYDRPHISCFNGPNGDMFMNYMDYSSCRYLFTNKQKDRMWAVLQPNWPRFSVTVSGKCGNYAVLFDGVDDYIDCGNDAGLNFSQQITIECWVKHNTGTPAVWEDIFMKGPYSFGFHFTPYTYYYSFQLPINGAWNELSSNVAPIAGVWTHLAATYDGTTQKIYVNGILTNSRLLSGNITNNTDVLTIGGMIPLLDNHYLNGAVDEVRIWNVARSKKQIQTSMNAHLKGNELGLVAYYNFSESVGYIAHNLHANSNYGNLINGVQWVINSNSGILPKQPNPIFALREHTNPFWQREATKALQ